MLSLRSDLTTFLGHLHDNHADISQRLLLHLKESGNYSHKDVNSIPETLKKYRDIIETDVELSNPNLLRRLRNKIETCEEAVKPLQERLANISPELYPVHMKLVSLRRCIKAAEAKRQVNIRFLCYYRHRS